MNKNEIFLGLVMLCSPLCLFIETEVSQEVALVVLGVQVICALGFIYIPLSINLSYLTIYNQRLRDIKDTLEWLLMGLTFTSVHAPS